jgi:predicted nucleic acid-binding protein
MKFLFIDTSGWIALYNRRDVFYHQAKELNAEFINNKYRLVTTNFILDESYTGLLYKTGHTAAVALGDDIRNSIAVKVIYINREIEEKSWSLFKKYSDKGFSFTDCTSFILLKDFQKDKRTEEIKILAADKHFKQMGYSIILER